MKLKKILGLTIGVAAVASLAACGSSNTTGGRETTTPTTTEAGTTTQQTSDFDAEARVATFDKTLSTTVKAVWTNEYNVTVDANGGNSNFSSFKHQIRSTVNLDIDLGTDLYVYGSKSWSDLEVGTEVKESEVLLYKAEGKYYYVTSTTAQVEVAEADVKTKVDEVIKEITSELAGSLTSASFLYNSTDKNYEMNNFGLTTTFAADELDDPVYADANGGLKVTYKPSYVGYATDQGMSDFPAAKGASEAAVIELITNTKGQVTSITETYSAGLDFKIMTPAPTVGINGTRKLTASYGDALTKKSTIAEAACTVSYGTASNGTFTVNDLEGDKYTEMKALDNNAEIAKDGHYIVVTPTPADGYEIDTVKVNGAETQIIAKGMYCFAPVAGENKIVVTFKATASAETPELLGKYQGTASNGTVMDVNVYKDGTFSVTCPGYGGAKAGDGTYTKDGSTLTLTSTNMQYFEVKTTEVTMTMAADFSSLTTDNFFNGEAITFTLKK